jgi:hypothetical protein
VTQRDAQEEGNDAHEGGKVRSHMSVPIFLCRGNIEQHIKGSEPIKIIK